MEENKIDKAIDSSVNKIDGAIDEVVQSRYMRKFYRFIIVPIIAGAIGIFIGVLLFAFLAIGGLDDGWAVNVGVLVGLVTFFIALGWLLKWR